MNLSDHLSPAEYEQLRVELDAELAPARGIAVGLCISLAFWAAVAALVLGVLL